PVAGSRLPGADWIIGAAKGGTMGTESRARCASVISFSRPALRSRFLASRVSLLTLLRSGLARPSELRRTPFEERSASLVGFGRSVVGRERREARLGVASDGRGVGVDRLLGELGRGRALLQELAAPSVGLGAQLHRRHHGVDETHRERLLG